MNERGGDSMVGEGEVLDMRATTAAVRGSERWLMAQRCIALDAITDFAYVFDLEGRLTFVNKPLLDLWGMALGEAIGKDFYDLKYPEALAAKLQRQIGEVIETKARVVDETPYTSPTGAGGFYQYIFSPVVGEDGRVKAVAGSTRDVSAFKRLEEERRELIRAVEAERGKLAGVIEQAPAFMCMLRGAEHVFELANERYYELIGKRDILGKTVREVLPEVAGQGYFELLDRVFRTGETFAGQEMPAMVRRREGGELERLYMNLVYQAVRDSEGRVTGVFAHGVDVTAMVMAREAVQESEARYRVMAMEAETANKAKDKFLAVLSHELRTPLSPIVMTVPGMESDPEMPAKFREDLAMVRRNVDLEVKLIDDLLDLSRVTSGKLRLQMERVGLHELLRHAIQSGTSDTLGKKLTVRAELEAGQDWVVVDPARMQQVVWNLLRNAVKFTPEGGEIVVRTFNVEGDRVVIEVRDNGVGIPGETLPFVFDAFEQGDARITRKFGGLGLGLAIAKAVVEMHGGTISAASGGLGLGATFVVMLDVAAAGGGGGEAAGGPCSEGAKRGGPCRVLLVEDHGDTARALSKVLRGMGYEVTTAGSVTAALAAAERGAFELLISDIGLPDATGYELMEALGRKQGIKGIALSGFGMEEDIRRSREAGFAEHLTKPVNLVQLEAMLGRIGRRA